MAAIADGQTTRLDDGVTPRRIPMSVDEFKRWYDREAGRRGEWVDGEVIEFVAPKTIHQQIAWFLGSLLGLFAQRRDLGEVVPQPEMRLREGGSYREPDLAFVSRANLGRIGPDGITGPADLVVEIVSDDSVQRDRHDKLVEYADAGVREYWVVDPRPLRQGMLVYVLNDERGYEQLLPDTDGRLRSSVVDGLWIDPTWLWSKPIPKVDDILALIDLA